MKLIFLFLLLLSPILRGQIDVILQSGNKGNITQLSFHSSEPYLMALDEYSTITIWDLQQQKQYSRITFSEPINEMVFMDNDLIAFATNTGITFWDFKKDKKIHFLETKEQVKQIEYRNHTLYFLTSKLYKYKLHGEPEDISGFINSTIGHFAIAEIEPWVALSINNEVIVADFKQKEILHRFNSNSADLDISYKSKSLTVASKRASIQIYDLDKGQKKAEISNTRSWKSYNAIYIGNGKAASGDDNDNIQIYDLSSGKVMKNVKNKAGQINTLIIHPNNNILATGGVNGKIHVYDYQSISKIQTCEAVSSNIISIYPSDKKHTFILGYDDGKVKTWDFKTHEVKTIHPPNKWLDNIMNSRFEAIQVRNNEAILKRTRESQIQSDKQNTKYIKLQWDKDFNLQKVSKHKASIEKTERLTKTDGAYFYEELKLEVPESENILSYFLDETNNFILAGMDNGFLYFFDRNSGQLKLKAFSINDYGFFYITPNHYYFASKSSLDAIGAKFDGKLLDFKQLDIRFNRPDKVLEVFPFYSKEYLSLLKKARLKRLQKLNLDPNQKFEPNKLPELTTNFADIPLQSEESALKLNFSASSPESQLKSLHIDLNGVPQYGLKGIPLSGNNALKEIEILLTSGSNKIEAYVETVDGYESLRQKAVVKFNQKHDPKLFVLSIGSGNFQSADFNLNYAEKDAKELTTLFNNNKTFTSVTTIQMTGKEVTKENVMKQIESLKVAKRNDVVIVFFAGHGLLDYKLDYYLSTYDMNFNAPEKNGISMIELESAISDLPCQNKILLLDACHSGELDKDEVISMEEVSKNEEGDIQFRKGLKSVGLEGSQSVFELSKNIFADLRRNNGVITISSAGADEYALEGGKWKNGAFTYAILEGLSSGSADLNNNRIITSNELSRFLFNKVPELTQGKQTPTSRAENLDKNIRIW